MEAIFGNNNINTSSTQGAFENILGVVAGNQFFDAEALKNIQTYELREAFNDWVENDFLSGDSDQENLFKTAEEIEDEKQYAGVSFGMRDFVQGMDENREDWNKFNKAQGERESLANLIETLEQKQAYELSQSGVSENNNQIAGLKIQILKVQEE